MASANACDRCHRRKTRCDKVRPQCGPCSKSGVSCLFSERLKEPLMRRDVFKNLERRLNQAQAKNRLLTERLIAHGERVLDEGADEEVDERLGSDALPQPSAAPVSPHAVQDQHDRRNDDVANEVSYLSTNVGGDRQFLGSASGLLFASLVRESIVSPQDGQISSSASLSDRPGYNVPGQRPNWGIDDSDLPPPELAKSLIEAYLAHDHLCFPILAPSFVRAIVSSIYQHRPSHGIHDPFESYVFNMVLAIATSQIHKYNWQALPDAETHHLRAMVHLDRVLREGGLKALQALLLLCHFKLSSSTKDTSGSLWHVVGIAVRICFEFGLHRESTYKSKPISRTESPPSSSSIEEDEIRRRCFWSTFAFDRIISITLGRPLAIRLEDIDAELPVADTYMSNDTPSSVSSPAGEQEVTNFMSQSRTAIFVHIVRYRLLCGKILTALHCSNRSIRKSETSVRGARNDLAVELEDWRLNIRSLGLPEIDLSMPNAETRSSFRSKAWYELLYHNAVLLLHRPSSATTPVPLDTGDLQRMFSSAEQAITLYSYLFRSSRINFSWSTLHACFIAGLSYVYTVSRHMREKRRQILSRVSGPTVSLQHDPSVMEITNVCRACSNILVAVTERCNAQKSSNVVFERLSDAVLADAVDLLVSSAVSKRMEQVTGRPLAQIVDGPATQSVNVHQVSNAEISLGAQEYFQVFKDVRFGPSADTQMVDPAHADYGLVGRSISAEPLLAADNALRDCFPDLQRMYDTHWGDDAIMQLGIDWLAEIDPTISGRTETTMNANFS